MANVVVGVYYPKSSEQPYSLIRYVDAILVSLSRCGIRFEIYSQDSLCSESVDVIWDPFCGWSQGPVWPVNHRSLAASKISTFHGAAPWSMDPIEFWGDLETAIARERDVDERLIWWLERFSEMDGVIVPSQFAAQELKETAGLSIDEISVISHGVDPKVFFESQDHLDKHGVLHVSSWQPKKNLSKILEACVGSSVISAESLHLIVPQCPSHIAMPDAPWIYLTRESQSDLVLRRRYQAAKVFVFPSLHETFGLPVLEAMACGCPVVTSRTAAMAELFSDAAILVDPRSSEEIREAIEDLICDQELRLECIEKGLALSKHLSWDTAALKYIEIFQQFAETRNKR